MTTYRVENPEGAEKHEENQYFEGDENLLELTSNSIWTGLKSVSTLLKN